MKKHCEYCNKITPHDSNGKCEVCKTAKITVREICDKMGVCRQAVYLKSNRKGFGIRKDDTQKGKDFRVYTKEEADILINQDNRYKPEPDTDPAA